MTNFAHHPDEDTPTAAIPQSDRGRPRPALGAGGSSNNDNRQEVRISWLRRVGRFLGACVLRVCSQGHKECANTNCWLQPICKCARADLAAARRAEARVWLIILLCGAVVIAVALLRSHS